MIQEMDNQTANWILDNFNSRFLLKVGKIEHLESLVKGNIYMKPLAFHIENEQNFPGKGVGDSEEGVMTKFENAKMLINGQVVGTSVNGTISSNTSNPIFCSSLVAFEPDGNNRVVYHPDKRMISDFTDGNEKNMVFC